MLADSLGYVARGADGVLFFQWRASAGGRGDVHPAMVPHAGPDSRIFREAVALGETLEKIGDVAGSVVTSDAAMLVDAASRWALESRSAPSPHVRHLDVARAGTRRWGGPDRLRLRAARRGPVALPALRRPRRLPAVRRGGRVTARVRRGRRPAGGDLLQRRRRPWHRIRTGGYPGALRDVLGVRVEEFHPLHPGTSAPLAMADAELTGHVWTERLRTEGAEVLAAYAAGPLAGLPALTRHPFGAGTAWYLSTLLAADDLTTLLRGAATAAGLPRAARPRRPAPGAARPRRRSTAGRVGHAPSRRPGPLLALRGQPRHRPGDAAGPRAGPAGRP